MREPAQPTNPTVGEAAPAALSCIGADERALPRQFLSIASQLPEEALAKLRALDSTRAMVTLKVQGRVLAPVAMAEFVVDFASEAAEKAETGGRMSAIVDPNDGVLPNFAFGFVAPGEVRGAAAGQQMDAIQRLIAAFEARFTSLQAQQQQMLQQIQLLALSGGMGNGGSQNQLKDLLDQFSAVGRVMREINPAQDPAALIQGTMGAMGTAMQSMVGLMQQTKAGIETVAGKPRETSLAQDVKELAEIPLVKDVVTGMVLKRTTAGSGTSPAAPPARNPLERLA